MLEFVENYGGSIVVGMIVLTVVVLIIAKGVKDKRAGKYSCGGNCSCCGCSGCTGGTNKNKR